MQGHFGIVHAWITLVCLDCNIKISQLLTTQKRCFFFFFVILVRGLFMGGRWSFKSCANQEWSNGQQSIYPIFVHTAGTLYCQALKATNLIQLLFFRLYFGLLFCLSSSSPARMDFWPLDRWCSCCSEDVSRGWTCFHPSTIDSIHGRELHDMDCQKLSRYSLLVKLNRRKCLQTLAGSP